MYIKSIVLDGFKSYGHRTEIAGFDKEFNAITGLNGSGKSNVLDSICFVLGISNLSHVRVGNLQDLIYKSGQCGVNKATVSITFDNSNPNQCPPGYENSTEITITRQIVLGGKNKFLINGTTVPAKKIQDLFCSIQMNVNNPHFLIMQGKITKVLNMKPYDILAMIEEAAGTKMYEAKKETTQKTIVKKDAKLKEIKEVVTEDLEPKLLKLRNERSEFLEYKKIETDLEYCLKKYQAYEYVACQRMYIKAKEAIEQEQITMKNIEDDMLNHKNEIKEIENDVAKMTKKAQAEGDENLQKAEAELKTAEKSQAQINAKVKAITDDINIEIATKTQLEKNFVDDTKTLKHKEAELAKVQSLFNKLKEADEMDTQAFLCSQKRYEALSAGMEINDEGEAETLQEQLMNVRQEASKAGSEMKQANVRLKFCEDQLQKKQQQRTSSANEVAKHQQAHDATSKEINKLQDDLKKLHFKEDRMIELQGNRKKFMQEISALNEKLDDFEVRRPYTQFKYRDPEPNFKKSSVYGVVCRLIEVKNEVANVAIETAAGGRLYNVVTDTDITVKKLLQKGELQQRTTFIPVNKLQVNVMSNNIISFAQNLVGAENVQPAMAHLDYNKRFKVVMEYIFGNVFVCKDLNVARQVAFHPRIKRKCVTLDGDIVDPVGTLTGGAPQKGGSVLSQLKEIKQAEAELSEKQRQLEEAEAEIGKMREKEEKFRNLKLQLELKENNLKLITDHFKMTSHYRQQEEIQNLQTEIGELKEKIQTCIENECKFKERVQELENRVINNSKGSRDQQIERAEAEMHKLKAKSDKSRKEWTKKEEDYRNFNFEIEELKKSLENTEQQIKKCEETIAELKAKLEEVTTESNSLTDTILTLQSVVKKEKGLITEKNKDIQKRNRQKEELENLITTCEVKLKEHEHKLKSLKNDSKNLEAKQGDLKKRVKGTNLEEAEQMTEEEARELEKKIRKGQERKNALGRTINNKAQTHFEQQEKEYDELKRKQKIVEQDKRKLIEIIKNLDRQKEEILSKAYDQISKDFGSIFSTLLPGANAKLLAPTGQTIFQGLEVKVSLGGVWKDSLTELSGGQRSLAALSLILAMLLFKPAPLYILDEVDAALDLSHTQNIGNMLKTHFKKSQFIIVSLKDGMFSNANVLFKTQFVDGVSTISRTVNRRA